MPPKQPDPQRELNILLQRARRNSRNPLLVKALDWTGNTVQSVLLPDADPWICARLQGMMVELSEYLRVPRVIVVSSMDDPVAGLGPITLTLVQGYHHLVLRQELGEQGKLRIASITYWKDEGERPTEHSPFENNGRLCH
jgi:hypothetical protein